MTYKSLLLLLLLLLLSLLLLSLPWLPFLHPRRNKCLPVSPIFETNLFYITLYGEKFLDKNKTLGCPFLRSRLNYLKSNGKESEYFEYIFCTKRNCMCCGPVGSISK